MAKVARVRSGRAPGLLGAALIYAAASFIHHLHNAVYLHAYPNLPQSLSVARVMAAWAATTLVGVVGYLLWQRGRRLAGLILLALYGALGLLGLAHYWRAPFGSHSCAMNATIGFEVATASCLLVFVVRELIGLAPPNNPPLRGSPGTPPGRSRT